MSIYREELLDHYEHPRHWGRLDRPTSSAEAENPLCGDRLTCDVRVARGVLAEVAFEGAGCAVSRAAASMLAERVAGTRLAAARALGANDVLALLGTPLSPTRVKCALLGLEVLHRALAGVGEPRVPPARRATPGRGTQRVHRGERG